MNCRNGATWPIITSLVLCLTLVLPALAKESTELSKKPNIVLVLADDLGIDALSLYGGQDHRTPNIDRLAEQGMRFSHCFSNPTCSPSRATLLTGVYSFRHGVKRVIWDRKRHKDLYLRTEHASFARQLKEAGYTTAIAGKWQLSFLDDRNTIRDFGFDRYQCWRIYDDQGEKTRRYHQPHFIRDGEIIAPEIADQYGPDVNVEFLSTFIKEHAGSGQPFLAYYTCLLPHFPWVPTPDSEDQNDPLQKNEGKGDPKFYPDMVAYLDKVVGRLMQAIEDAGVTDNTVFLFVADNGTDQELQNNFGDGHVVQGGKGSMTDRGTRVPLIVRWPKQIEAGSVCEDLVDFTDFLPTLCELSSAPLPKQKTHGQSFLAQLMGQPGRVRSWVYLQNYEQRHLRTKDYIYNPQEGLRPVAELWKGPSKPFEEPLTSEQEAAKQRLQEISLDQQDTKPL